MQIVRANGIFFLTQFYHQRHLSTSQGKMKHILLTLILVMTCAANIMAGE
ncbi:MAG: hypothetical protein U9R57_16725 [Thermodesulfobacteriota bacterium]|nr:hypothetical protein [Thermodesulfobacteriota bacterium]